MGAEGTPTLKKVLWYGFKLHLVVDAAYELPVGFTVTRAAAAELPRAQELLDQLASGQPWLLERAELLMGNRGYDGTGFLTRLWDEYQIKPVVDIRNCWQDGEATRLIAGKDNVVYDYAGNVYCHCPLTNQRRAMAYGGFEADRGTLKYRCPARHYGVSCQGLESCSACRGVRIPLAVDRRIFVPVARSSYRWKQLQATDGGGTGLQPSGRIVRL